MEFTCFSLLALFGGGKPVTFVSFCLYWCVPVKNDVASAYTGTSGEKTRAGVKTADSQLSLTDYPTRLFSV
jgi:hypothetical protein